ncbi:MAG: hypothetical protein ACLT8E_10730 [Akkermansia sp.]
MKKLNELASAMGGWGYLTYSGFSKRPAAQPTSFLTGTVLISAWMAGKSFGLSLDDKIFTRALKFLKSQRTPAGTYVYSLSHSFYPGRPINRHTGSLARTPACDYAIRLWEPEDISLRQLVDGLGRLWSRRGWLTMALQNQLPMKVSPKFRLLFLLRILLFRNVPGHAGAKPGKASCIPVGGRYSHPPGNRRGLVGLPPV